MKFGSQKAGAGQATAQIDDNPDSPGRLTKDRTLPQTAQGASPKTALCPRQPRAPHGKTHSGPDGPGRLTKNRTLPQPPHQKAHSAPAPHQKPQFGWSEARRMRLSVRTRAQNALSRDVPRPECAFPSRRGAREVWGNPPARLRGTMENASTGQIRSSNPPPGCGVGCAGVRKSRLGVWSHGKAHSEALWPSSLTEKRTLQPVPHGKAQFGWSEARRMRLSVRTRAQNALSRDVPRPECAFP